MFQPSSNLHRIPFVKAVANGKIYIAEIDTDPVNPANQIPVYIENEDDPRPDCSAANLSTQPQNRIQRSTGKIATVQGHSMAIYDAYGFQVDYIANVMKYDPDPRFQETGWSRMDSKVA
ncbi:hypothetical protein KCP78_11435 [Salmonella enterica subsp. enterica]|nr:hypothetical protein KCP78_11435 [Salmonella enterica subsp. enterica]